MRPPPLRLRVLIAALPPLLADIVRDALADEDEVELLQRAEGDLARTVAGLGADLLVTAEPGARLTPPLLALMHQHQGLRILLLDADGRSAALCRLVPERRAIADPTPRSLAEAVRAAAREG